MTDRTQRGRSAQEVTSRSEVRVVLALLLLAAVIRLPTLQQPLIERHSFRQTQTAYTALVYHEHGVDLLHPMLPVFGAPFEVPFEFPLFQAVAAAVMSWGLSPDVALRTTALAFFLLSALLLWGLVRHVGGRTAAAATLVLFLFSPFSLLWSRASLIEYPAVAGAIGWLWAGLLWRERRQFIYAVASVGAGIVAMLVKPTTGALWVLPLLAYTVATEGRGWRSWVRARRDPLLAAIVIVPFVAAVLWTRHADSIKGSTDATQWLTSSRLNGWNFGTIHERLVWSNWTTVMDRVTTELTGYPAVLLPLFALVGLRSTAARFWAALVAVPVLTVLIFWNLYVVHDYYLAAVSPILAAGTGFGISRLWHAWARNRRPGLLVGGLATWVAALLVVNPSISTVAYQRVSVETTLPAVEEAARLTLPTDLVVFEGFDWSPAVPYYSRRSGRMIRPRPEERATAASLAAEGYRVLVTDHLENGIAADTIRAGRWTGVLGRWVYLTGDLPQDLRNAPIAATDILPDPGTIDLAQPVTVTCGEAGAVLPRTEGTMVLRFAAGTPRTAKVSFDPGYGDLPIRDYVLISPHAGEGPVTVGCRDAATVTIVAVGSLPPGTPGI